MLFGQKKDMGKVGRGNLKTAKETGWSNFGSWRSTSQRKWARVQRSEELSKKGSPTKVGKTCGLSLHR